MKLAITAEDGGWCQPTATSSPCSDRNLPGTIGIFNAGLKIPVEAAFDTITVARKPVAPAR